MKFYNRKQLRLKDYDYGNYGFYYVTLCVNERKKLLSDIVVNDALVVPKIAPTILGEKIKDCFYNIEKMNENIYIDCFVLMPNHIHAIIVIENDVFDGEDIEKKYGFEINERRGRRSLQGLMKDFKSVTTRIYKKSYNSDKSLWQKSYYEHIIRNKKSYEEIYNYIEKNPAKWSEDKYNPENFKEMKIITK